MGCEPAASRQGPGHSPSFHERPGQAPSHPVLHFPDEGLAALGLPHFLLTGPSTPPGHGHLHGWPGTWGTEDSWSQWGHRGPGRRQMGQEGEGGGDAHERAWRASKNGASAALSSAKGEAASGCAPGRSPGEDRAAGAQSPLLQPQLGSSCVPLTVPHSPHILCLECLLV